MGQFGLQQQDLPPWAPRELRPVPPHSEEQSAVTRAWPGRRERNTSQRLAESAAQRPKAHLCPRRRKTRKQASQAEGLRLNLAALAALPPPAKRQSHGNRPHSTRRWAPTKATAEPRELQGPPLRAGLAAPEPKASPADNPEQPLPAAPQKTRSRVSQSLPGRVLPPSHPTCPDPRAAHFLASRLLARKTMSASRYLGDYLLYSWY